MLVFVQVPLQAVLGLAHSHFLVLLLQSGVEPVHVPHDTLPPQPSEAVLQFCPLRHASAIVFGWQTHLLVALLHVGVDPLHVPHVTVPPQPSEAVLQFCPLRHAWATVFGWHTHLLVVLLQVGVDPLHVPHDTVPPQPLEAVLQFCPLMHASVTVFGLQVHAAGEPMHVSLLAHAVHRAVSAHPLFTSVVTHLSPHFLVPAPQLPRTQAPAWQTSVPVPAAGQLVESQLVGPQP